MKTIYKKRVCEYCWSKPPEFMINIKHSKERWNVCPECYDELIYTI